MGRSEPGRLVQTALAVLELKVRAVTPTVGGSSLRLYRVTDTAGRRYAVRVGRPTDAPLLDREARHLRAARQASMPCPTVLRRADSAVVSALLTTWEPGAPLAQVLQEHPARAHHLVSAAGALQAQLHRAGAGISGVRLDAGWALPHSPDEEAALAACPDDGPATLLHLDFHPLNLLADERRITAVVDWMNAGWGDARRDVARTTALLILELTRPGSRLQPVVPAVLAAWWAGYESVAGSLRDMGPYIVWAGLATIRDLAGKRSTDDVAWMRETVAAWQAGSWSPPRRQDEDPSSVG